MISYEGVMFDIMSELNRAALKHGLEQTPFSTKMDPREKLVILVEEVGEVARAMTYDEGSPDELYAELVQTAAMAVAWAASMKTEY